MRIEEIQTVCFVGAGTMGCYNSIVAAVSGYDVVLYDVDQDTLDQAPGRHEEFAAMLVAHNYCTQEAISQAVQRISFAANLERATANADLVSESIFERLDIKRAVHQELDLVCPRSTILTTNSSRLLVSDIEDVVSRGDRFAALHSHLGSPLVDIVGGPRTSAATIEVLNRYVLSTGGVPLLLKKEHPGYVLNAVLGPLLGTAMLLVSEGVATLQEIDRAWMRHCNAPMGPFGMIDLFGLNLIYDTWQYREEDPSKAHQRAKILALLQPFIDAGELGIKSARGFYQYPDPDYQRAGFLDDAADDAVSYNALITAVIGSAVLVAAHDVAEPNDIDRAWMTGTYLEAGPFAILAQLGTTAFLSLLAAQVAAGRFNPDSAKTVRDYLQGGAGKEKLHA